MPGVRRWQPGRRYDETDVPQPSNLPSTANRVGDLPQRLRLETRDLHTLSERSGVMAQLIGGRLALEGYCALLRNLHAIYAALEAALERHPDEPSVVALADQPLHRASALAADLHALCGPGWPAALPLTAAARAYVRRLQAQADDEPLLLTAHAYVRYLGDLHGGQMLKRLVARSLAAAGDTLPAGALHFYEFGSEAQVLALRTDFRDGLHRIEVDAAAASRLVAEARWAFGQHVRLFNELAAKAQPAADASA